MRVDFALVATTMRDEVIDYYETRGRTLDHAGGRRTLETNSDDVSARGALLVDLLGRAGVDAFDGVELADLGCGFGPLSLFFASLGATVTAVDCDAEILDVGRRAAEAFELPALFVPGRIEALALPSASFDVVVINNALCYLVDEADRRRALGHALRVLRPGGVLVARDPNRLHPVDPFTRLPLLHRLGPGAGVRVAAAVGRSRPRVRLLSPPRLARALRRAGFADVAVRGHVPSELAWLPPRYGRYHHTIARRPDRGARHRHA